MKDNMTNKTVVAHSKPCPECKHPVTTPCGLCMACAKQMIDGGHARTIEGNIIAATIHSRIEKKYGNNSVRRT